MSEGNGGHDDTPDARGEVMGPTRCAHGIQGDIYCEDCEKNKDRLMAFFGNEPLNRAERRKTEKENRHKRYQEAYLAGTD
jgi:hypothetical protein